MSFGFRMVMMAGLLCASMAARAEYKEVWNPPEAAAGGHHGVARVPAKPVKPVKPVKPQKTVAKAAPPKSKEKEKMKSGAVKQASAPRKVAQTASRPTHASSTVVANQTPHASSNAPKSSELPPILK